MYILRSVLRLAAFFAALVAYVRLLRPEHRQKLCHVAFVANIVHVNILPFLAKGISLRDDDGALCMHVFVLEQRESPFFTNILRHVFDTWAYKSESVTLHSLEAKATQITQVLAGIPNILFYADEVFHPSAFSL